MKKIILIASLMMVVMPAWVMAQGMGGSSKPPEGLAGIWQRSAGNLTPVILTDYGRKKSQDTIVFDDPNTRCEGYSIARSGLSSFGVTKIETGPDYIIMRYEANAGTRKIYLDGKRLSDDENLNGSSIGTVRRGVVQISSDNFGPEGKNALMGNGVQGSGSVYWMSDKFRMFESLRVIDKDTLDYVLVMDDPIMTTWPRVVHAQWKRLPDNTPFIQDKCSPDDVAHYTPADIEKLREEKRAEHAASAKQGKASNDESY